MKQQLKAWLHNFVEGFGIAIRALLSNKTRAILTTLGIVIGVVTVTLMLMIIQGLNRSFQQQIAFLGSNTVYIDPWPWVWDDNWWKYINRPRINMEQYEMVKQRASLADAVAPRIATRRTVAFRDKALSGVAILGTTSDFAYISSAQPEFGRFISDTDNRSSRRVCVIGVDVVKELFGNFNPLGRDLRIGSNNYRVVGILEKQGSTFGQSRDNIIIIPIETFINTYGRNRSVTIAVRAKDGTDIDDLTDELTGIMRRARKLKPLQEDNFAINRQEALESFYKAMTAGVYGAGLIIGGISLLVGGIGIMNIMLVSVTERTWEVGMRKAVGARTSHILWQFLIEAMLICMLGGAIGIGLAFLGGLAIQNSLPAVLPPWLALAAVAFSAIVGLVFGLFPAAKAAKMDPIAALRQK